MQRRIVLVGSTGRTGRLVAAELEGRSPVLLVGRDTDALRSLAASTGHDWVAAGLSDLGGVLVPGDVVLTCAGPYDAIGDEVVRAAITVGATYLDVSGEPAFLARVYGEHASAAARAGVCLLPAVGYEYLPGHLVAGAALDVAGPSASRVEIAYLADGGLEAGSAGGRASLLRALGRPTVTYRGGHHVQERIGARTGTFTAGGRRRRTASLGGAEVWTLPRRQPRLRGVDVHTGWFGPASPAVGVAARLASVARTLGVDHIVDAGIGALGDGPEAALQQGTSRFVARVRDRHGTLLARREAVGGNPIMLAGRLAAATASRLAEIDLRELPPGASDPLSVLGSDGLERVSGWAGLVLTSSVSGRS